MITLDKPLVERIDSFISRGLSEGVGNRDGQMCVEAAWSSTEARAEGLRDLAIAQLGSRDVVDEAEFATLLAEKTIRILIPKLFRKYFSNNPDMMKAANECESNGSYDAASYAASYAASEAARAASYAARAASYAARADEFLIEMAAIGLSCLRELNSPGVKLLKMPR